MSNIAKFKRNPMKIAAIEMFALSPYTSSKKVAEKLGISIHTIHAWRKDPNFIEACYDRYMVEFGSQLPSVLNAMVREAQEGNVQAARLVLEHSGKLVKNVNITIDSPFEKFLKNVPDVEVVEDEDWDQEEVTDEEVKETLEDVKEKVESSEIDWKKVSKELGFNSSSKQEFIDAVNSFIQKNTPKEDVKSDSTKMINDLLKLNDRELLAEELKADGMDEYDIEETLDKMEDSGTLKRESVRIKRQLKNALKQEKTRITETAKKEEQERIKNLEQNKKDLQAHLKSVDSYFGGKVSQKDKKDLYKYITSGKFNDDIYDSHENVAEIAWMWKNKEKIKKILFSEGFEKGKAHIFNKITSPSTNRSSRPTTRIKSGAFDPSEFMKE